MADAGKCGWSPVKCNLAVYKHGEQQGEQNHLILNRVKTKKIIEDYLLQNIPHRLTMDFCFGSHQSRGSKISTSWITHLFLYSMLCRWSVECWSYNYSDTTMTWQSARKWCQERYTDMVAIQNQVEIAHLNSQLPRKDNYYWIGIRKLNEVWTWVGTNKPLTTEATNWAWKEPNNGMKGKKVGANEDCVEMYIKRDTEAGKWNDEWCMKNKTALCYTASCESDSCHYGECVETIDSHRCECFDGFYGEKCEHVVQCDGEEVTVAAKASVSCSHPYGNYSYGSECRYSCEEGYRLSASETMKCIGSGNWSEQPPTCELVQCKELSAPERGSVERFNPLGSSSYLSTCVFSCDEGYELVGSKSGSLQCGASGFWNDSEPFCVAVRCPALKHPENGVVRCGEDRDMMFSYEGSCSFSCAQGYRLLGASTVTCTSKAEWSETMPRCEAITCQRPVGDHQLLTECSHTSDKLRPDSTCSFRCNAGFELQGVPSIQCSEEGEWRADIPTCKALQCPPPVVPVRGLVNCMVPSLLSPVSAGAPQPQGSVCMFSCDEGHELVGSKSGSLQCGASGFWNDSEPFCVAVRCPALQHPENGVVRCGEDRDMMFSYEASCSFSCAQGYRLLGASTVTCTSKAEWSETMPRCEAITCQRPEGDNQLLTECSHTSDKLRPDSTCSFRCNAGFELQGVPSIQCSEEGEWSADIPTCKALQCPPPVVPVRGQVNCMVPSLLSPVSAGAPQPQGSVCMFSCDEGHELVGSKSGSLQCGASGFWNDSEPFCVAVRCPALKHPENGVVRCGEDRDMMFSYEASCSFSCAQGYRLLGASTATCTSKAEWSETMPRCEAITCQRPEGDNQLLTECSHTSDKLRPDSTCSFRCNAGFELQGVPSIQCSEEGEWSADIPTCKALQCPPAVVPERGLVNCMVPSLLSPVSAGAPQPQGSVCMFSCDEGHELEGALSMECTQSGHWSSIPPTCSVVRCPLLEAPVNGGINCSDSELIYNIQCSFTCDQDYSLRGHELVTCDRHGNWTEATPICQAEPVLKPATTMGLAAGAVSLSSLSLAAWLLKRLKRKGNKFELNSNSEIEDPPQFYKNSVDSLI